MVSVTVFQIVTSFFKAIITVFSSSQDSYSRKVKSLVTSSFTSRSQEKNDTSKDKVTLADSMYVN